MNVYVVLAVGLASFAVFYALGLLTAKWLREAKPPCPHRWRILIEKYPTFAQNRWKCDECGTCRNFPHNQPPIKPSKKLCDMGHLHITDNVFTTAEWEEWDDEWPDTIGTTNRVG